MDNHLKKHTVFKPQRRKKNIAHGIDIVQRTLRISILEQLIDGGANSQFTILKPARTPSHQTLTPILKR